MAQIKFRVDHGQSINFKTSHGDKSKRQTTVQVRCDSFEPALSTWRKAGLINPRKCNRDGFYPAILHTLMNEPQEMDLRNGGLLITAKNATLEHGVLTCDFTDEKLHGIVDGGHTTDAILDAIKASNDLGLQKELSQAYVNIEIRLGLSRDEVIKLAASRNATKNVNNHSIANMEGKFDGIKAGLGELLSPRIAYYQGDDGYPINHTVQLLLALNCWAFDEDNPPASMTRSFYSMNKWIQQLDVRPSPAMHLSKHALEILKFADRVQSSFTKHWIRGGRSAYGYQSFYGTTKPTAANQKTKLILSDKTLNYGVDFRILFGIVQAYRANVVQDMRSRDLWSVDIDALTEATLPKIVGKLADQWDNSHRLDDLVAPAIMENTYNIVAGAVRKLSKQTA